MAVVRYAFRAGFLPDFLPGLHPRGHGGRRDDRGDGGPVRASWRRP
jgi:hypothetical protein